MWDSALEKFGSPARATRRSLRNKGADGGAIAEEASQVRASLTARRACLCALEALAVPAWARAI